MGGKLNYSFSDEATGYWVVTTEELARWLGYPADHFGPGFAAGRYSGAKGRKFFATLEEAIAFEPSFPNAEPVQRTASNALGRHLAALENND